MDNISQFFVFWHMQLHMSSYIYLLKYSLFFQVLISSSIDVVFLLSTVPDTHKFPLDARIRIASHARIRIASHRIACGEMRACASIRIACAKCAHSHRMRGNARIRIVCAEMRAFASYARKCAHSHRMRRNARITTRKTRTWDCGNDASPSVLVQDPWNWVCSR